MKNFGIFPVPIKFFNNGVMDQMLRENNDFVKLTTSVQRKYQGYIDKFVKIVSIFILNSL